MALSCATSVPGRACRCSVASLAIGLEKFVPGRVHGVPIQGASFTLHVPTSHGLTAVYTGRTRVPASRASQEFFTFIFFTFMMKQSAYHGGRLASWDIVTLAVTEWP